MATAHTLPPSVAPKQQMGTSLRGNPKQGNGARIHRLFDRTLAKAWWSAGRVLFFAIAGGLPVLTISAHVFGMADIHWMALYICLPIAALAAVLGLLRSREAMLVRRGMVAGLIAVTLYDATRMPFVVAGIWPDFIPRVGGWVAGDGEANAFLGYFWRYVGNGGGIAIFFVLLCAVLGVRRHLPMVGVGYGMFVWSGLMGTVAFAAAGPTLLFPLTPLSVTLSLIGHLVYGSVLGWVFGRMLRRDPSMADLHVRDLPGLSFVLSKIGRRAAPVGAADAAASIQTRIHAPARPGQPLTASHTADLALALNNLGHWLWEVGRHEDSVSATEEAVGIQRPLAMDNPDTFEPVLAGSLDSLGVRLANLGRYSEALVVAEDSVAAYRRLVKRAPVEVEPDLAALLVNIGGWLWEVGRHEEALTATEEAVGIQRRLATASPDAYAPVLAGSLNRLGVQLAELGRYPDALPVAEESVALYRRLTASIADLAQPVATEPVATEPVNGPHTPGDPELAGRGRPGTSRTTKEQLTRPGHSTPRRTN